MGPARWAPTDALDPRRAARSTAFALAATAIDKGGAMVMVLLLARILGAEDFGRYAALMALVAFCQIAAELGQEPVLVRLLAQEPSGVAPLVGAGIALRIALGCLVGAVLVAAGGQIVPGIGRGALVVAALALIAGAGAALRALFRTAQRLEWLCLTAAAGLSAFALALAGVFILDLGVTGAVAAWGVGQLAVSVAGAAIATRLLPVWPRWNRALAARLAGSGWPLALNALLVTITLRVGQLIVLRFEGATAVGYLAAGARLAEAFALVPEALMLVLLPVLAASEGGARETQRRVSARTARYLGVLALAVILVTSIMAHELLAVLYGHAYVAGAPALRILVWLAVLAASGTVVTNVLIAQGLERALLRANLLTALVTLALSLAMVPRLGFVGAAAATLAASIVGQAALLILPATRRAVAACLQPLVVPILGAVALTLAGVAMPGPRAGVAAVALALFVGFLALSRTLGAADLVLLRRALGRG